MKRYFQNAQRVALPGSALSNDVRQIPRRGEYGNAFEYAERVEVGIARNQAIDLAGMGCVEKFVVLRVATDVKQAPRSNHLAVAHQDYDGPFAGFGRNVAVELLMRLSLVNERPLRRAWLPMAAVAARNSAADSARDLRFDSRPISIATRMRTMRFCSSLRAAKCAAVSGLTGIAGSVIVFMSSLYGVSRAFKGGCPRPNMDESLRTTSRLLRADRVIE